jgi:hypothetical protein
MLALASGDFCASLYILSVQYIFNKLQRKNNYALLAKRVMAQGENMSNLPYKFQGRLLIPNLIPIPQSDISVDNTDGQTHDLANLYSFYTTWAYMWKCYNDVYSSKCAAHRHQADLKHESIFFFAQCTENV